MAAVVEAWKINQKFVTLKFNMKMVTKLYKRLAEGEPVVGSRKSLVDSGLSSVVRRLAFLAAFTLCLTAFSFHPYYMSVTEFTYNAAEKEVQVSCKILVLDPMFKTSKMHECKIMMVHAPSNEQRLHGS